MMKRLIVFLFLLTLPLFLVSCGGDEEKPQTQLVRKAPVPPPAPEAPPQAVEITEKPATTLEPVKRNPFLSFIIIQKGREVETKIKGPLECCDLGTFKLVAVITNIDNPAALVQAPDNKRYIVKIGDTIGARDGKVIHIGAGGLIVREHERDETGKIISSVNIELKMPAKEEKGKPR